MARARADRRRMVCAEGPVGSLRVTHEDDGVSMVLEALGKEAQRPGNHRQSLRIVLLATDTVIASSHFDQNLQPCASNFAPGLQLQGCHNRTDRQYLGVPWHISSVCRMSRHGTAANRREKTDCPAHRCKIERCSGNQGRPFGAVSCAGHLFEALFCCWCPKLRTSAAEEQQGLREGITKHHKCWSEAVPSLQQAPSNASA